MLVTELVAQVFSLPAHAFQSTTEHDASQLAISAAFDMAWTAARQSLQHCYC